MHQLNHILITYEIAGNQRDVKHDLAGFVGDNQLYPPANQKRGALNKEHRESRAGNVLYRIPNILSPTSIEETRSGEGQTIISTVPQQRRDGRRQRASNSQLDKYALGRTESICEYTIRLHGMRPSGLCSCKLCSKDREGSAGLRNTLVVSHLRRYGFPRYSSGKEYSVFGTRSREMLDAGEKSGHEIEAELGIGTGQVYRWRRQLQAEGERAFPGNGKPRDEELAALCKENRARGSRDPAKSS